MARTESAGRSEPDLATQRWFWRTIYYAILVIAGSAWLVRGEQPFLPAFAVQTLAGFAFSALILGSIVLGFAVGTWVGKLNGVLGFLVGLVVSVAAFMFVGLLSTQIPVIGPAIDRVVSLIE